jgi:predicted AAA+ superfamily ATPase
MNSTLRIALDQIKPWMFRGKALIVTGARQVGKTTLMQALVQNHNNVLWLNADEINVRERLKNININAIADVVGNHTIVVIDEVQRIENCGLLLKVMVDNFKHVQFLATGSSALEISETIFEPLTGRHLLFKMYGFGMAELYPRHSPFQLEQELPFHLIYGCYPDVCNNRDVAETLLKNLCDQYLYKDVLVWKDLRKPELLDKLLKLLAFQVCGEVSLHELANTLKVKSETVESYIDLLEKSFVVYRLTAYSNNPRKEVSKMSKVYFWDNGIRNALIDNFNALEMRNDHGQLWENFIISERLKINAWRYTNRKGYFWRNYNQSEVDYVETEKGTLRAFEMKRNNQSKATISRAFNNAYPTAETDVITPAKTLGFIF